ncbi:AraC family transcriptional regulator [Paraburkholderia tropica]|uniref:AraC family transcriptional regulator n=1 Tax=Paraburkholderia tropica TaxID=92647 RepID=UPI0009F36AA2|nr:AraC family transcriptional regulator [Paraburkholderia tropica]
MTGPNTFSIPPGALATLDLSLERLCARAGVPVSNTWVTSDFFRLWDAADEAMDDRSAGLRFGAEGVARGYAVAAIVALHAPDFRHALSALARYKRLTCPELVEVDAKGDEVSVRYRWLQATGDVPRLLVDTTMASLRALAHMGTAGRVLPLRVELTRRPTDEVLLRRHFECPIVFGAPDNAMVFERAALDTPFATADGGAFAHVLNAFEACIARGEGFPLIVSEVRVAIARQLREGRHPRICNIARRLGVSSRTLQRQLGAAGTSYQQQLASVRRTMASRLLVNTDLDEIAIALLLGFAEPNSFARAFRSWERTTPQRWRKHQPGHSLSATKEDH